MREASYPAISEIVPHEGKMVLLERVLAHAADSTCCAVAIDAQVLFRDPDGSIPSWVGIEYMAQCIAAHAGLLARAEGHKPRVGFLVGSRSLRLHVERFCAGQTLSVSAVHLWGRGAGMATFQCRIEDAGTCALLAEARLSCYSPGDAASWRAGT